ncbi:TetR/AcrR family transcriptional regulator C-terminal domain-containing protein [Clostridium sp. Ade.TY]|uniref:TetR/AcrR family transcriptional regulator C-terminal domain-containing protein n=1 Tax=Clostridium sp. Ade.TY TaxID=1391647 RepID=UPI000402A401|nr:TetR/AcrR family transcriptional regulator C-terminal domain-containing protein [Clostridium sp. Ade.TY]
MNTKREEVHLALQESFKKLILKYNFEKITVKMITDGASLIRPTFYNHYADKYELLEEICYNDIFSGIEMLIENKMPKEAISYMFTRIENNKEFYFQAAKVTGQNSFEEIMTKHLSKIFVKLFKQHDRSNKGLKEKFSAEYVAEYYSRGLTYIIKRWIEDGISVSAKDLSNKYEMLINNSLENIIDNLIE